MFQLIFGDVDEVYHRKAISLEEESLTGCASYNTYSLVEWMQSGSAKTASRIIEKPRKLNHSNHVSE